MATMKEKVKASTTRENFKELMEKYVPPAKEIIAEIIDREPEGMPHMELWNLFCKRIPFKWKIIKISIINVGYDEMKIFLIALEDLLKEKRIKKQKGIYYP